MLAESQKHIVIKGLGLVNDISRYVVDICVYTLKSGEEEKGGFFLVNTLLCAVSSIRGKLPQ